MTGSTHARLRFGLLIPQGSLASWQRSVLVELLKTDDSEIILAIRDGSPKPPGGWPDRLRSPNVLWHLYNNRWVSARSAAVQRVDCSDILAGVEQVTASALPRGRFSQYFEPDVVARVRDANLDVLLRLGFGIIRGEILTAAKFGVWSYHHDDERVIRGGPPGFWEVRDALPTTGVMLQRLTDVLDGGVPLARAAFKTSRRSYPANRDRSAFGAAGLVAKVAREVRAGLLDPMRVPNPRLHQTKPADLGEIRHNPTNKQMVGFLARQAWRQLSERGKGIFVAPRWGVGVLDASDHRAEGNPAWLPEPQHGYDADPFPAARDGLCAILVEEFDERFGRGQISALANSEGSWTRHSGVIPTECHASYPFLFEHDGELYCTPETAACGSTSLWRCDEFPTGWTKVATLINEPLVDPTVLRHDDRWYLFATKLDSPNDRLYLYHASDLKGPWTDHPGNPVKIDVTSSRGAGVPFVIGGALFRPAQDCSTTYGGAITVNRVIQLDCGAFGEEVAYRITPRSGKYPNGRHTISVGRDVTLIDGHRLTVSPHRVRREILARLRKRSIGAKEPASA